MKPNGFHALADNILIKQSTRNIKGIEIVIKTKIYLGDARITGDCSRSDMCIP